MPITSILETASNINLTNSEIADANHTYKEIVWLGEKEYIEVEVGEKDLRHSLQDALVADGHNTLDAENLASKVKFIVITGETATSNPEKEAGRVDISGNTACTLNLPRITQNITSYLKVPGIEANPEVKVRAVTEALNYLWMHERQHLVDAANPELKQRMSKASKFADIAVNKSYYPILTSGGILMMSYLTNTPYSSEAKILSAGVFASLVSLRVATKFWYENLSLQERRAFNHRGQDLKEKSPFKCEAYSFGK